MGRWHIGSIAAMALVAALLFAPDPPSAFRPEYDPRVYPAAALSAMHFGPEDRIFTHDEWGDYLIYRLYPNTKVFVDGRTDFYGPRFETQYLDVYRVKYNWEQILQRYDINTILLPAGASLTGALKETSRWRVAYDDGISVVFRSFPHARDSGTQVSAAPGSGTGRDREITKIQARGHTITLPSHSRSTRGSEPL
jgi:hypothetical protein